MAEAPRGRVTITLGRSGQVVKRSGAASDDSLPVAGTKRSVRDRLGGNIDSSLLNGGQLNNKRQRGDGQRASLSDLHIGKDDLRFKLLQKSAFRRVQSDNNQKGMDLRQKLSRLGQPPVNSYETRQQMPDSKERIPEPRDRMPESRETSILGKIPSTRSMDDFPHVTTSISYSPWTLDHLRQRSPDRVMGASRGLSPPRNVELQRRPVGRTYDDVRTVPYMGKDVADALRPVSTASFVTKSTLPTTSAKPMPPGPPIPSTVPPSNIVQKSSYLGDEQQTVEGLLHSLGLGKYAIIFKAEEVSNLGLWLNSSKGFHFLKKNGVHGRQCYLLMVDMTALKQMGENDLKELGIPMGPRKKILLALLPRSKRQP
ncbi:uncharacterized protein LOC105780187 isoform X1 [Gossypium raimondii]|uniref:uncharacterized protein LOC105780187 isoform X1 n=1 Tax=Gossypium raimondii TaxID=29730 RepID=UPI00063AE705|nr:uncharacterized protein LOC105780187 isoform X1 [Gossypium raimondii]